MALVATEDGTPVPAAAVFTSNQAAAAPVLVSKQHLSKTGGLASGVVLTAGNANAATGTEGNTAADKLCSQIGEGLGVSGEHLMICQTGLIGVPFPINLALAALPKLLKTRESDGATAERAARAIMTTDTVPKQVVVHDDEFVVGGMAKGAAMLAPDMATMLAVLTTDAKCEPDKLQAILRHAVATTFNSLSVDGCTSTNDTVVLLASGSRGHVPERALTTAVEEACGSLAEQMAKDAEGATLVAVIRVEGAWSDAEGLRAARKVADSLLVKCSLNGRDPYWGRVVSELGSAGVAFDIDRVSVAYGPTVVCEEGVALPYDVAALEQYLAGNFVELHCHLGLGTGSGVVMTSDLGYGYLDENRGTS